MGKEGIKLFDAESCAKMNQLEDEQGKSIAEEAEKMEEKKLDWKIIQENIKHFEAKISILCSKENGFYRKKLPTLNTKESGLEENILKKNTKKLVINISHFKYFPINQLINSNTSRLLICRCLLIVMCIILYCTCTCKFT